MAYEVHLKDFDGPLDLLLHLISRAKVDIRDIFVSEITEQYLASMDDIASLDMDAASEFLAMAAMLLEIKSRALLPKPPKVEEGEETPEQALIRRLTEYAALKEGIGQMRAFEEAAARMFEKLPEEIPLPPPVFELPNLTMDALMEAMRRVIARAAEERVRAAYLRLAAEEPERAVAVRQLQRDKLSIQGGMFVIAARVRKGPCTFESLFVDFPTRDEIVTLFMAILEMLRMGKLHLEQTETFGEIILSERKTEDGTEGNAGSD